MTKPQQPELARSGHTPVSEGSAKATAGKVPRSRDGNGPIPPDNQPGHHPPHEQDKPERPPPRPRTRARRTPAPRPETPRRQVPATRQRYSFAFERRLAAPAAAFGIIPSRAHVDVGPDDLVVRFGWWSVHTGLANIEAVDVTGPYTWLKVIGPPHISLADRGVTFATNTKRGVCIRFRKPVTALLPGGLLRHPAITVTVDDVEGLARTLHAYLTEAAPT